MIESGVNFYNKWIYVRPKISIERDNDTVSISIQLM